MIGVRARARVTVKLYLPAATSEMLALLRLGVRIPVTVGARGVVGLG